MRVFVIFICSIVLKLFYRHKVYGIEHLKTSKGTIIAPNHVSYLDPPIIGASSPYEVHFLAREGLFKVPGFGWLIRKLNTHPVAKGSGNLGTIKLACELLNDGKKIVIFPEGKRSQDGQLQSGQSGIGLLVIRTGSVVIPTYIHGAYEIWDIRKKFPKLNGRTVCIFGSPLSFSLNDEDRKQLQTSIANKVIEAIAKLKQWYLDGAQGTPP